MFVYPCACARAVCFVCVCCEGVCVCAGVCVMCHVRVQVLGHTWEEALSLAHVVSSLNAQSKAARFLCVCIIYIYV
jgi:hypothetical protein